MIGIHHLPSLVQRSAKRRGQGLGSGKGKTGGRGTKGQKARRSSPLMIGDAGAKFLRRMPLLRGKMKNKSFSLSPVVIDLSQLSVFAKGDQVTVETLREKHLVSKDALSRGVKILGKGTLSHALDVHVPCSSSAKASIESAGGTVIQKEKSKKKK